MTDITCGICGSKMFVSDEPFDIPEGSYLTCDRCYKEITGEED